MKLLIADDHTLFRDALVQYIERANPDAHVTLSKDFFGAMDKLESDPVQDLVVLDLRMPGMEGMNGFKDMMLKYPNQRVALMSGVAEEEDVQEALNAGVVGYFPKTMSGKALLKAIEFVVDGGVFQPKGNNTNFAPSYYADKMPSAKPRNQQCDSVNTMFTEREKEVLSHLVDGASNKEIASALNVQIVTVKLHVRGVCRKLNAKNRTQAALKAKDLGITPISNDGTS